MTEQQKTDAHFEKLAKKVAYEWEMDFERASDGFAEISDICIAYFDLPVILDLKITWKQYLNWENHALEAYKHKRTFANLRNYIEMTRSTLNIRKEQNN